MDEKNKNNESSENTDFTKFLKGEFEKTPTQENKKEGNKSIKITLTLLCCFFAISMISALYIVFNPNKNVTKNEITEIKDSAASVKNTLSFLKNAKDTITEIVKDSFEKMFNVEVKESSKVLNTLVLRGLRELTDEKEVRVIFSEEDYQNFNKEKFKYLCVYRLNMLIQ